MKQMVNFKLEENIILQIKKLAEENERNLSAQIRFMLLQYLKENNDDSTGTKN